MQARLDGVRRNAEAGCRFIDAQLLNLAQHEDRTERIRQRVDGALKQTPRLGAGGVLLRGRGGRLGAREGDHLGAGERTVRSVLSVQSDHGSSLPQPPQRLVEDDAAQPSGQAGGVAELVDVGEGKDPGVLHRVLGLGGVAQHAARHADERLVVPLHQNAKGGGVTQPDAPGEIRVGNRYTLSDPPGPVHALAPRVRAFDAGCGVQVPAQKE